MNCTKCGIKIGRLDNYGSSDCPLCYDCSAVIEKEREAAKQEQNIRPFSTETLLKMFFKRKENGKYVCVKRSIFYAIGGFILLPLSFGFILQMIEYFTLPSTPLLFDIYFFFISLFGFLSISFFALLFIIIGLFTVITEIDFNTREVRITKKNFRGKTRTYTFSLDEVLITAIRMGSATTGSVHLATQWIVRAGFHNENINIAILSDNAYNEKECVEKMLGLYRFFFPDRAVTERNIITNGTVFAVLSDEEAVHFLNGTIEEDSKSEQENVKQPDPSAKWDFLIEKKENGFKSFVKKAVTYLKMVWG